MAACGVQQPAYASPGPKRRAKVFRLFGRAFVGPLMLSLSIPNNNFCSGNESSLLLPVQAEMISILLVDAGTLSRVMLNVPEDR